MLAEGDDVTRLRAIIEVMQQGGITRLQLPDGTVLERPPVSPLEAAARAAATRTTTEPDDDEGEDDERDERELESRWDEYWTRATRSSGGMVPPFPGAETASRFFGSRPG